MLTHNLNGTVKMGTTEDELKIKYDCIPENEWSLIRQDPNHKFIQNVCISSSYQIYEAPSVDRPAEVGVMFYDKNIYQINERENTITISIAIWSFWQDPRIKVKNGTLKKPIKLLPITNNWKCIWTPFTVSKIARLKSLTYTNNQMIGQIELMRDFDVTGDVNSKDIFPSDAPIVSATTNMKVKISCKFSFFISSMN